MRDSLASRHDLSPLFIVHVETIYQRLNLEVYRQVALNRPEDLGEVGVAKRQLAPHRVVLLVERSAGYQYANNRTSVAQTMAARYASGGRPFVRSLSSCSTDRRLPVHPVSE